MRSIERFAKEVVAPALESLRGRQADIIRGDLGAGEWEVAAISLVETHPEVLTADQVAELSDIAITFDSVDRPIAERVIAKYGSLATA